MQQNSGELAECVGKKRYPSYYAADRGANHMNLKQRVTRGNPYHCPFCNFYHVGNSMHTKRKNNRHARRNWL